jgi:transcriptional regulator with XRE-family HTH domain
MQPGNGKMMTLVLSTGETIELAGIGTDLIKCCLRGNIEHFRKQAGYTEEDVAAILDIELQTYRCYAHGLINVPASRLATLANLFRCRVSDLLGPRPSGKPPANENDWLQDEVSDLAYELCGESIQMCRSHAGYTQVQVAEWIKIDEKTYQKYEAGRVNIPMSNLVRLAVCFQCPVDFFFIPSDLLREKLIKDQPAD